MNTLRDIFLAMVVGGAEIIYITRGHASTESDFRKVVYARGVRHLAFCRGYV